MIRALTTANDIITQIPKQPVFTGKASKKVIILPTPENITLTTTVQDIITGIAIQICNLMLSLKGVISTPKRTESVSTEG